MKNALRNGVLALLAVVLFMPQAVLARGEHSGFYAIGELFFPIELTTALDLSSEDLDFGFVGLESDLALEREPDQERFRAGYRFGRRAAIEFSYLSIQRTAPAVLTRDFAVPPLFPGAPTSVEVELDVVTQFDTEDFEIDFLYYFLQNEAWEAGLSVGVHSIAADFAIAGEGTVSVPGFGSVSFDGVEADSADVPLPVIGLHGRARLTRRVYLSGRYKIFDASYDEYSGEYNEFEAKLEVRLGKTFAVGAGIFQGELNVREDNADRMSRSLRILAVDLEREGVFAFVRLGK